jgi:hypothetical protein
MGTSASKALRLGPATLPKTPAFGPPPPAAPASPPPAALLSWARELRRDPDLAPVIAADLKSFRTALERAVRAQFPLKRGRPCDPLLDEACRMVAQGRPIPEVLRAQIRDWDRLDPYTRMLASKWLHHAYRRRYGKHQRRAAPKSRTIPAPESPADFNR